MPSPRDIHVHFQHGGRGGCSKHPTSQFFVILLSCPLFLMSSSIHEEILEAQSQGYTLLYLNYRKLSELPEELLSLSKIKKLYLKRNVLRKLVSGAILAQMRSNYVFKVLKSFAFVLLSASRYLETWKSSRTVSSYSELNGSSCFFAAT